MDHRVFVVGTVLGLALLSPATPPTVAGANNTTIGGDKCLSAPAAFVRAFKTGLKPQARGKLGELHAVKSRAHITAGPHGFAVGTYFVSARVRGFGIATWAVDSDAFKKGGSGFIAAVGPVARKVSVFGVDIPPAAVRSWGLTEKTHGYAESRNCVK